MATQVISFRASGAFLEWLQEQQCDMESLSQVAQRRLKQDMDNEIQAPVSSSSVPATVSTLKSTRVDSQETFQTQTDLEDICKQYFAQAMVQMNHAVAESEARLKAEFLGELIA